jgi:hypothetical protein
MRSENAPVSSAPDGVFRPIRRNLRSRVTNHNALLEGVDGRSATARRFRDIIAALVTDQGGLDRMSEARFQLIRRFAAASVLAEAMEARLANGEQIEIAEHAQLVSSLVRLAQRIGIDRRLKNVTPHLHDYLETVDAEPSSDS